MTPQVQCVRCNKWFAACETKCPNCAEREADIRKAIELIEGSFVWVDTRQGLDYWSDVVRNLNDMVQS